MLSPVLRSYVVLLSFEFHLARGNFAKLYAAVRRRACRDSQYDDGTIDQVCSAVDHACIWYWKQVLCLQRSAATACLLRRYGAKAQMVIAARPMPFQGAWKGIGRQ